MYFKLKPYRSEDCFWWPTPLLSLLSFPALPFFLRGSTLLLRVWWAFDERWKSESVTQFRQSCRVDGAEHPHARCLSISLRSPSPSAFRWLIIESFVFVCSRPGKRLKGEQKRRWWRERVQKEKEKSSAGSCWVSERPPHYFYRDDVICVRACGVFI